MFALKKIDYISSLSSLLEICVDMSNFIGELEFWYSEPLAWNMTLFSPEMEDEKWIFGNFLSKNRFYKF